MITDTNRAQLHVLMPDGIARLLATRAHMYMQLKRDYVEGLRDSFDLVVIGAWRGIGRKVSNGYKGFAGRQGFAEDSIVAY
jgi:hypothetical protein